MILRPHEPKLLMPVPQWEWREPSLAQPKDQFGRQNRTRFVIRGWKVDGGLIDEQWYDDRDQFDADLYRHIVEEPYRDVFWEWAVSTNLVASPGSLLSYAVPSDWDSTDNFIDTIGGGASGCASGGGTGQTAFGGGGGAWGGYADMVLTPGGSASYSIAATTAGVSNTNILVGNPGKTTWFNGAAYASAPVGAQGGLGGTRTGSSTGTGPAGGTGKGTATFPGGTGGSRSGGNTGRYSCGGGGAAGRNGAGGNAVAVTGAFGGHAGGNGDAGFGGAGGAGGNSTTLPPGSNGTNLNGIGAGGGGGGLSGNSNAVSGGGGNYGAASGGTTGSGVCVTGTGAQGCIVVTYTPLIPSTGNFFMVM